MHTGAATSDMPSALTPHQVLVDGTPNGVRRQAVALRNVTLTPLVIAKLPRGAGQAAVVKAWEKAGVQAKWDASSWAQKRAAKARRAATTDFERCVAGPVLCYDMRSDARGPSRSVC